MELGEEIKALDRGTMLSLFRFVLAAAFLLVGSLMADSATSTDRLERVSYLSEATGKERDYFVYLPRGFEDRAHWPVMLFLHGNGERGDGKGDLDWVLMHGPLYEAWIQKRELPFVIIAPQLPIFNQEEIDDGL